LSEASAAATQDSALRKRRAIYFALVGAGLLAGVFGAIASGRSREAAPVWLDMLVVAFLLCAAAGLLLIRARPIPYRLGLLALGSALLAYWVVSPRGYDWTQPLLEPNDLLAQLLFFGYIMLLVVAWMLLARSGLGWTATLASYLGLGLTLTVLYALVVEPVPWLSGVIFTLLWPWVVLPTFRR